VVRWTWRPLERVSVVAVMPVRDPAVVMLARAAGGEPCEVVRVRDGDCVFARTEAWAGIVRLVGIDGPELWHPRRGFERGGVEAKDALTKLVCGQRLCALRDRLQPDCDRYGRRLRWLFPAGKIESINAVMVRIGWAWCMRDFPCELAAELRGLEREARAVGRGVWAWRGL
jgi:micrococcal nuclease